MVRIYTHLKYVLLLHLYLVLSIGMLSEWYEGAVSALDDGNLCPSSQLTPPATDSASAEGLFTLLWLWCLNFMLTDAYPSGEIGFDFLGWFQYEQLPCQYVIVVVDDVSV